MYLNKEAGRPVKRLSIVPIVAKCLRRVRIEKNSLGLALEDLW